MSFFSSEEIVLLLDLLRMKRMYSTDKELTIVNALIKKFESLDKHS